MLSQDSQSHLFQISSANFYLYFQFMIDQEMAE